MKQFQKVYRQRNAIGGFTLIELMIAVAVMAVLLAVAVPSYRQYIERSHRDVVQGDLVLFAQAMEKAATVRFSFTGLANSGDTGTPASKVFASQAPLQADTKLYNLTISAASANAYTLVATPITGTLMAGTGRLTLNNIGQRCWFENQDTSGGVCSTW